MKLFGERHLSEDAQRLLPDVTEVTNIAYAIHVASDATLVGTAFRAVAETIVTQFLALTAPSGTVDAAYLESIRGIALAHARGLTRRKQAWLRELHDAEREKNSSLERVREARNNTQGLNAAWKLLSPAILLIAGYMCGKIIALIVPNDIASQTGERMPALLLGLVFVFVGRAFSFWVMDRQRSAIELAYRKRCARADLDYEEAKLKEWQVSQSQLCEKWREYTGKEYLLTASFKMVLESDLFVRERLARDTSSPQNSNIRLIRRILRMVRRVRRPLFRGRVSSAAAFEKVNQ